MTIGILIAAVFGICFLITLILLIKEKSKNSAFNKEFRKETSKISDKLNRLSYGNLDQHFDVEKSSLSIEVQEGLDDIKRNFNKVTAESLSRVCFVGTDAWFEGIECARQISRRLPSGGKIAVVITSSLNALVMSQRYRSFISTIKKDYPRIQIVGYFEAQANQENAAKYAASIADTVDGIYITGNSAVPGVTQGLDQAGKLGQVFILCHDLDSTIAESIRNGIVSDTVVCLPFGQGHDSVIHLFNSLNAGWKPYQPRLMQTLKSVNKENLDQFWDEEKEEPRQDAFEIEGKVKPLPNNSARKHRILAFCEDWNDSLRQIVSGIEKARDELSEFGCEVKICVLNQMKTSEYEVFEKAESAIEEELDQGLDGICSFVGFAKFADFLNAYSKQGITIATFNSEPLSLRSMIEWLTTSSIQLEKFTNEFKTNLEKVTESYGRISSSLNNVAAISSEQKLSIRKGADSVLKIASFIDKTAENEGLEEESVQQTADLSRSLEEISRKFKSKIGGLTSMGEQVKKSVEKTQAIKKYSEKILSIIEIIDNISEQTNLLAFNAAVESTHAGEYGHGFKVISTEIRNLATQSANSTRDITDLIENMRKAVNEGIEANNIMMETVNDQVKGISEASVQLNDISNGILRDVQQVRKVVTQNSEVFKQMKSSASGITEVMQGSSKVSEETTSTISDVNSEVMQMNEKISTMTSKLNQLTELVSIMEGSVCSFSS